MDINRSGTARHNDDFFHRRIANPVMRRIAGHLPGQALIETTGRRTGLKRRTPVGGRVRDGAFWMVSNHGPGSDYVRNMRADPRVRVQVRSRWRDGTAHLLPDDDARERLRHLPRFNSLMVRLMGSELMTIRIDLDPLPDDAEDTP
jgi:deazaflavin-dependent oxidoreductase (nitroreductase family)